MKCIPMQNEREIYTDRPTGSSLLRETESCRDSRERERERERVCITEIVKTERGWVGGKTLSNLLFTPSQPARLYQGDR